MREGKYFFACFLNLLAINLRECQSGINAEKISGFPMIIRYGYVYNDIIQRGNT